MNTVINEDDYEERDELNVMHYPKPKWMDWNEIPWEAGRKIRNKRRYKKLLKKYHYIVWDKDVNCWVWFPRITLHAIIYKGFDRWGVVA